MVRKLRNDYPMTMYSSLRAKVISAACLCLGFSGTMALADTEPPDISNWDCRWCEYGEGWFTGINAGLGYVSDDSFKFGQYSGLGSKGMFAILDGSSEYRDASGLFWNLDLHLLGSDRISAGAEGGRQGHYGFYVTYDQLPNLLQDKTRTPFGGYDVLQLPGDWVRADTTAGMTALTASLKPVTLETERRRLVVGGDFMPWQHWTMSLRYRSEEKIGRQSLGAPIGGLLIAQFPFRTESAVIQMPTDSVTRSVDLTAAYQARNWHLNVGYQGSFFDAKQDNLVWQNPFNGPSGSAADAGRIGLPPDNQFHQLHSTLAFQLGARTRATARLAIGRMSQNEEFLPYSINPGFQNSLPRATFDGEVNTQNYQFKLNSRPVRKLSLNASFIYNDRTNDSPRSSFDYVVTDAAFSAAPRINRTYNFNSQTFGVNGTYRLGRGTRATFGYKRKDIDRELQQIENSIEDSYWAAISFSPHETLDLSVRITDSERDGDEFRLEPDTDPQQNPLIRKYNMADRDRRELSGTISYTPNTVLGFGLTLDYSDDDYTESQIGLTSSESRSVTADVTIAPKQYWQILAFVSHQDIDSSQAGSQTFSTPSWAADTSDSFGTAGVTLQYQPEGNRFSFNFDYTFSESFGETEIVDTFAVSNPFPDLTTQLQRVELYANYVVSEKLSWRLGWLFEEYDSADWGRDGVTVDSIPNVLWLDEEVFSYKIHMPVVFLQYKF
jgi:MtrB/PioB family decaheme-associated outer membrane protein